MSKAKLDAWSKRLLRVYGITAGQWRKMYELQRRRCRICGKLGHRGKSTKTRRRLYVDHDHKGTKRVRGLIDFRCNHRLLGRGLEDPALHRAAAEYLESDFDARAL